MKHKVTLIIATKDRPALDRILADVDCINNENGVVNVQEVTEVSNES